MAGHLGKAHAGEYGSKTFSGAVNSTKSKPQLHRLLNKSAILHLTLGDSTYLDGCVCVKLSYNYKGPMTKAYVRRTTFYSSIHTGPTRSRYWPIASHVARASRSKPSISTYLNGGLGGDRRGTRTHIRRGGSDHRGQRDRQPGHQGLARSGLGPPRSLTDRWPHQSPASDDWKGFYKPSSHRSKKSWWGRKPASTIRPSLLDRTSTRIDRLHPRSVHTIQEPFMCSLRTLPHKPGTGNK